MEFQKIFKRSYLDKLKEGIKNGSLIKYYQSDTFLFDDQSTLVTPAINAPDKLSLITTDTSSKGFEDCENAKKIHIAYKDLTPLQASDERFWIYLAHVDCFKYMSMRWPGIRTNNAKDPSKYILDHWFISSPTQSNFLRHGISGLWWSAYLSYDAENSENPYHLTEVLYRNVDFATRTLGTYNLSRHKEAVIGILSFIKNNPQLFENKFEDKTRFITKYINLIGGTKPVSFMKRGFFEQSLEAVTTKIEAL
ncbi:DUF6339 family protein [Lacibacter sp. H407]|uniref:DUF6339 family protein n=1 Tax=Lacibacter sp. H407 TaxID=3133423 RepID=UPI0030BAB944